MIYRDDIFIISSLGVSLSLTFLVFVPLCLSLWVTLRCQQIDASDQTCWAELQSTPIKDFTIAPDTWSTLSNTQKMYNDTDDGGMKSVKKEKVIHQHGKDADHSRIKQVFVKGCSTLDASITYLRQKVSTYKVFIKMKQYYPEISNFYNVLVVLLLHFALLYIKSCLKSIIDASRLRMCCNFLSAGSFIWTHKHTHISGICSANEVHLISLETLQGVHPPTHIRAHKHTQCT